MIFVNPLTIDVSQKNNTHTMPVARAKAVQHKDKGKILQHKKRASLAICFDLVEDQRPGHTKGNFYALLS